METPIPLSEVLVRLPAPAEATAARNQGAGSAAFVVLYREHYAALAAYLYRRTGCRHATEDLLAEVFLAAYRGLPRYRDRGRPILFWLYGIATRLVGRWLRGRRSEEPLAAAAEVPAPDEPVREVAAAEEAARARALLARLPRRFQDVLALHYLEDLRVEEIAQALALRPGTVKSRLSRGRARLRRLLEGRRP